MSKRVVAAVALMGWLAGGALAETGVTRVDDPLEKGFALVGDLGDPGAAGAPLEAGARAWVAAHPERIGETGALAVIEVQDGTPVRIVRFRAERGAGLEVGVIFDRAGRVIGASRAPGPRPPHPDSPVRRPVPPLAIASAVSLPGRVAVAPADDPRAPAGYGKAFPDVVTADVTLTDLAPGAVLDGVHFATARLDGKRAAASAQGHLHEPQAQVEPKLVKLHPDFLETTAYYHAVRARGAVAAHGAAARYDAIVGRLRLIVDQTHTQSGRKLWGNAFYSPNDNALHFARDDAFPSAADPSVITHELGHAAWRALCGAEPEKPVPLEELAVYEGHADAFAALVTGDPVFGRYWLPGKEQRDCRFPKPHHVDEHTDQHTLGQVYSGLLWDLRAGREGGAWQSLVLGAVQLAPRPVTPAALVSGLLLADRFFHDGAHRTAILKVARARKVPVDLPGS